METFQQHFRISAQTQNGTNRGNNKFSGTQSGLEAIGKMLSDMMGGTQGSLVVKPTGPLMVNGNLVSSPVRFNAKVAI